MGRIRSVTHTSGMSETPMSFSDRDLDEVSETTQEPDL